MLNWSIRRCRNGEGCTDTEFTLKSEMVYPDPDECTSSHWDKQLHTFDGSQDV